MRRGAETFPLAFFQNARLVGTEACVGEGLRFDHTYPDLRSLVKKAASQFLRGAERRRGASAT
jgi:hypothetical protein